MTSGKLVGLALIGIAVIVFAGLVFRTYQTVPGETIVLLDSETGRYATEACIAAGTVAPDFPVADMEAAGVDQVTGRLVRTTYAAIRAQGEEDDTILPDDVCRNAGGFLVERTLFGGLLG